MKKTTQKQIDWNKQIQDTINALTLIADESNIPRDAVADALKDAIIKAYTKEYPETELEVIIDIDNKRIGINKLFKVVEPYDDLNDYTEISVKDEKIKEANLHVGEIYKEAVHLSELSKLSLGMYLSQTLKGNITSQTHKQIYAQWKPRVGEVIYAEVEEFDARSGIARINLERGVYGIVTRQESIPNEILKARVKYNFYIKDVKEQTKGWPVLLSRADAGLVRYLLNINIPEIQEKVIEIKDIARVAGFKTKLSVISHQASVEAAGTVIGPRGSRIKTIQEQISGEHIEVITYLDDFKHYIVNVCSPAEIVGYAIKEPTTPEERREITLVAQPDKLALLIGKRGANVRLISDILKANIEILTVDEAHQDNLQYQHVDMKSLRQQAFNRSYSKFHAGRDVLSQYNRSRPQRNINVANQQSNKKSKDSILADFKSMNKDDLMKELSGVDTSNNSNDDINDDYEE